MVGLFFYGTELLHVNRFHHFLAVSNRRLLESLTAAKFFYNAGFFKFTFEFLQSAFDVLAFFYLYDNHFLVSMFDVNYLLTCF